MAAAVDQVNIRRRLGRFLAIMVVITGTGTIGYVVIEGWAVVDALYMTVITLSTVGFGEVAPLSLEGRALTIALIAAGVSSAGYRVGAIGEYVVSEQVRSMLRRQRMTKRIERMREHYIICGYGRVGRRVLQDLRERGQQAVLIDVDERLAEEMDEHDIGIVGDASEDASLREAGIDRASGLVAATGDDATNIFNTLTARA